MLNWKHAKNRHQSPLTQFSRHNYDEFRSHQFYGRQDSPKAITPTSIHSSSHLLPTNGNNHRIEGRMQASNFIFIQYRQPNKTVPVEYFEVVDEKTKRKRRIRMALMCCLIALCNCLVLAGIGVGLYFGLKDFKCELLK